MLDSVPYKSGWLEGVVGHIYARDNDIADATAEHNCKFSAMHHREGPFEVIGSASHSLQLICMSLHSTVRSLTLDGCAI